MLTTREIRHHLNKPDEIYECELLHHQPGYIVLRYVNKKAYQLGPIHIQNGSITIGHYWQQNNYVLWEIYRPNNELQGYLVHICDKLIIGDDYVEYQDLVLDLWFYPDGTVVYLDQEELERCRVEGLTSPQAYKNIQAQAAQLAGNFATVKAKLSKVCGSIWQFRHY